VALSLLLWDSVKLVVPEHCSLVVQEQDDFVVVVFGWQDPVSVAEVPGSETLVLTSVVVPDFVFGMEVPDPGSDGVPDLAFEEVSEPAWGLLVLVEVPA
jgi:hypothetical protein